MWRDTRLQTDPIAGVGGSKVSRVSLGANWLRAVVDRYGDATSRDDVTMMLFLFALPHQFEVTREASGGSTRWGVTLSWGI